MVILRFDYFNWKGSAWLVEARVENQEGIGQLVRMVNGDVTNELSFILMDDVNWKGSA